MPIIRSSRVLYSWLLPVVCGALGFKLSVWLRAARKPNTQPSAPHHTDNLKTKVPNTTGSNKLYNTLEILIMGIMLPETCWASNKICSKKFLLHLVGIYFHILTTMHGQNHFKLFVFLSPFYYSNSFALTKKQTNSMVHSKLSAASAVSFQPCKNFVTILWNSIFVAVFNHCVYFYPLSCLLHVQLISSFLINLSLSWLIYLNRVWRGLQIIKFVVMRFRPDSSYLFPRRPTYLPQDPFLKHPDQMFCSWGWDTKFWHPLWKNG
jgi:hypothetical protein